MNETGLAQKQDIDGVRRAQETTNRLLSKIVDLLDEQVRLLTWQFRSDPPPDEPEAVAAVREDSR